MKTQTVNNGSECYAPWACTDINGDPYIPASLSYQVWNLTDGTKVAGPTSVAPAQSGQITLTASINTMAVGNTTIEQRIVILKVGIPGGSFRNDFAFYNLTYQPGTP